ncbi:MAG TPA: chemotaxis protein CheD [Chloroflexota bacterium]|jgi:chemotaxis protein CheD|nr:chemotaxis protein CheD [Chloroflexota bacterium]
MALLGMRAAPTADKTDPAPAAPGSVVVGLGEAKVVTRASTEDCLVAYGLGSCVVICLWDPSAGVAGMAHVVLPGADPTGVANPKFARSALPALVALMQAHGAASDPRRYVARLAGGAEVLAIGGTGKLPRIGEQNAAAVRDALVSAGVTIQAEDLGGTRGRSVWFDPREGGQVRVRVVGSNERNL